jgi:predicted HTH domain antitoxin
VQKNIQLFKEQDIIVTQMAELSTSSVAILQHGASGEI